MYYLLDYASQDNLDLQECPQFTNQQLLTIYDSYDNIIHSPETKFCVFDSYRRQLDDRIHPSIHIREQYQITYPVTCAAVLYYYD